MALPVLDATFASSANLPRRQMLAKWLVNASYSGSIADYWSLPECYLWAKIAVAAGGPKTEADYISLPKNYVWSDIYKAVSGSSTETIDRGEKEALGWIAAAVNGDTANPSLVSTYINWPWRYQVASIISKLAVDSDAQSFITTSGATDVEAIDKFVKGVKNLGLWNSMVSWPLRSSQNAGTGTTAYSLGGLGTYNGTLVNGPTWGNSGINFVSNSTKISIPLVSAASSITTSGGYSSFSVLNFASRSSSNSNFSHRLNTKIGGGQLYTDSGGENLRAAEATTTGQRFTNQNLSSGSFVGAGFKTTWGVLKTDNTGFSIYNTAASNTSVGTFGSPVPPPFEDGTAAGLMTNIGGAWTGNVTLAMVAFWLVATSPSQAVAVRNLYATTLGNSLGL